MGGLLLDLLLVNILHVDGESSRGVHPLVADVALEVLGLLVIHQHLLVLKLAVTVPTDNRETNI